MRRLLVVAAMAAGSSSVFWSVAPARAANQLELYGVVDVGLATTRVSGLGTRQQVLGGGQTDNLWGLAAPRSWTAAGGRRSAWKAVSTPPTAPATTTPGCSTTAPGSAWATPALAN